MSWWRKANSGDAGAVNGWIKIQSIWRKSNTGDAGSENGWIRIKSIWRHTGFGIWEKIFGPGLPYIDGANPPELYFVDANGFETIDSPFNGMSLYLTRGMWEEEPLEFTMAIEKSESPYTTWVNFESTPFKKIYLEYKDEDYLYKFPATVSARPSISKTNVRNKIKFRGKIIAENSEGTNTFTTTPLAARLWFSINTFEITDETPTTITFSWSYNDILPVDIPTDIWSHQIQLYNSLDEPILPVPEVAYLYDTSITINLPSDLDPEETYSWELEAIADDYYREFTGFPYASDGPTAEYSYIEWMPGGVVQDPEITFSGRTVSGFNVNWLSPDAERYDVNIFDSITGNSLYGYPKITEDLGATVFGLSEAKLITVSVKGLSGSQNQNESNEVLKSIRTLNIGIQAVLSDAYDQSSNGYKVLIENYSEIDDFDIQIDVTNGDASRSGDIITISNVSRDLPSCVTVTTSKIDDINLTSHSYDVAVSPQTCETIGTWYCVQYVNTTPITCSTFESNSDVSGTNSFTSTMCYTTPSCCAYTSYGQWTPLTECLNGKRSKSRVNTIYNLNCTSNTVIETIEEDCWYCTTSVPDNCAGCTQTIESTNKSATGTGYNITCSQTTYPTCQTPCVCNTNTEADCGDWVMSQDCTGNPPKRTYIRDCPSGSPCAEIKQTDCWYCTESYPASANCAGCTQTIETSNLSASGTGYSRSCSQSGYPSCQTPCTCTSLKEADCGDWVMSQDCTGNPPKRTYIRDCPSGSPCAEVKQTDCWYCTESYPAEANCAGCTQTIETSNISASGSGYSRSCSQSGYPSCQTPCTCTSLKEADCGDWVKTQNCVGNPPQSTYIRDCPPGSPCSETRVESCWYCTESYQENCSGCNYTVQTSNISASGSGYSRSCSQSGYPSCGTPCTCTSTKEAECGAWSCGSCTGSPPSRTCTRTCPAGSPCITSKTESCWYCTESYPASANCAGCTQTIETSNISASGSGYSRSCSQSGYPSCQTPCTCTSTKEAECGAWSCGSCTGSPPSRTCTRTCPAGSPCITSKTESCWYCTTSVQSNCAGCTQTIETSNISSSGSGYQTSCSQTAYPACQTPCVQYWCKTTRDDYCQLSGPFTTNQAGTVGGFITVCSTGSSNPYTCVAPPYFPFFPPFFPFFPPYFAPSPYFPFFPPFFPFFPPFFPFFPPYFAAPPYFPFFPPYFPFFPPFFKTSQKCLNENTQVLTTDGYKAAKDISVGDKLYTIAPQDMSDGKVENAQIPAKVNFVEVEVVKAEASDKSEMIKFNDLEDLVTGTQPVFVKTANAEHAPNAIIATYKMASEVQVGDILIQVEPEQCKVSEIKVKSVEIISGNFQVYDIRTSPWPWFIIKDILIIS